MSSREPSEKYLVAFSFAGEQRDLVRSVAEAVELRLGRGTVFFDEWFEAYLAGNDADLRLQDVYGKRAVLVVLCVSKPYGKKPWTRAEHEAIRALKMRLQQSKDERDSHRILPLRVGDGDVPGIFENTICPEIRERPIAASAELIIERLRLIQPDAIPWVPTIFLAEATPDLRGKKDRWSVESALKQPQLSFRVLPERTYDRSSLTACQKAIDEDLRDSLLFVQILGESGSDSSPALPHGFEGLQFARAKAAGKPCLRWRPNDLDLEAIKQFSAPYHQYLTDADTTAYGKLQTDERVQAGFLNDFLPTIEDTVRKLLARQSKPGGKKLVESRGLLLSPQKVDANLAQEFDQRAKHGAFSDIADEAYPLLDVYEDEAGLVVLYGQSPYDWVKQRVKECREIALNHANNPPICAIYIGPPDPKPPLPKRPANFHVIHHDDPKALAAYLAEVAAKGGSP